MKHIFTALLLAISLIVVAFAATNITVLVNGSSSSIPAITENGTVLVAARPFLASLGGTLAGLAPNKVSVKLCGKITVLDFKVRERQPFLDGVLSAKALGFQAILNGAQLEITGTPCQTSSATSQPAPSIGYDVTFSSTLELKGDGGMITSVIDGRGTLDSARVGETFLLQGEPGIPHDSTLTILAEGLIPLKYSSLTMPHDNKCSISTLDGSAYMMLLLGKSTSGKPLKVLGIDTGNGGGRGFAPQEIVSCPGKSVGLKAWHSAFNYAAREYLGAVLAPGDQPRPMLLTLALTLADESIYQAYPNGEAGKGVIRGLSTLQLVAHK